MRLSLAINLLVLLAMLTGCALAETPGSQNTAYPGESQDIQQPGQVEQSSSLPYPEYQDGDAVSAGVTVALLNGGSVAKATLKPNGEVVIFLKDGRALTTIQPFENAFSKWVEECGQSCSSIEITQE